MLGLSKTNLLFLIILIEGYVVLASELLAIRLLVPFVGSGVETTSIIISAVLLPLAVGYYYGGDGFARRWRKSRSQFQVTSSIRQILLRNVTLSMAFLAAGFSYLLIETLGVGLTEISLGDRLSFTTIYVCLFLVGPMYWLGQTVPLTSHYFSKRKLSTVTGRMLFFSTVGSFFGSIISTLILMNWIGVHNTASVTLGLLLLLSLLVAGRSLMVFVCVAIFALFLSFNNDGLFRMLAVFSNNAYNMIQVVEVNEDGDKYFFVNRSGSSRYSPVDPNRRWSYILFFENELIYSLQQKHGRPLDILVLGAAGFDLGRYDKTNNYTFVDIDPDVKKVAEAHYSKGPIGENKKFVPTSARAYLNQEKKAYDLIIVDVYSHEHSLPLEATSKEFYQSVKDHLKPDGIMGANIIASGALEDRFSIRIHNTLTSVFPGLTRHIVKARNFETQKLEKKTLFGARNIAYVFFNHQMTEDRGIYTDNHNTSSLDKP